MKEAFLEVITHLFLITDSKSFTYTRLGCCCSQYGLVVWQFSLQVRKLDCKVRNGKAGNADPARFGEHILSSLALSGNKWIGYTKPYLHLFLLTNHKAGCRFAMHRKNKFPIQEKLNSTARIVQRARDAKRKSFCSTAQCIDQLPHNKFLKHK